MIVFCDEYHALTWQEVGDDAVVGFFLVLGLAICAWALYKLANGPS